MNEYENKYTMSPSYGQCEHGSNKISLNNHSNTINGCGSSVGTGASTES